MISEVVEYLVVIDCMVCQMIVDGCLCGYCFGICFVCLCCDEVDGVMYLFGGVV